MVKRGRKKQTKSEKVFGIAGSSPKSILKGAIAVTLANRVVSPLISQVGGNNQIIQEMRFPLSLAAVGTFVDGNKDLRSAGIKIAGAIALNRFVIPKITGLGVTGQKINGNGQLPILEGINTQ